LPANVYTLCINVAYCSNVWLRLLWCCK